MLRINLRRNRKSRLTRKTNDYEKNIFWTDCLFGNFADQY
jgi:hypothetical protein